jgi:autotransporter-associated beta strand protein
MSGLGTLTANLGASGIFRMSGTPSLVVGSNGIVVKLAATSTITANVIGVGDNTGKGSSYTLKLGSTANTFNANTISIGQSANGRSSGELSFETGTGTLKLRAADGTSAVTAMNLINSGLTGSANFIATANFAGHDVDAKITTLTMGRRSATGAASANATFTFDTGTLEVGTLNLGEIANVGANAGTINAIMNIGGGTATFDSINMATNAGTGNLVNGTLNLTDGTTTVYGNILKGGGNGTTATLNLTGGTLDMTAGNIGSLANSINLTAGSGTLKNVAQINGGGSLEKTTARTLVLDGTNTYTGGTNVSAGTLLINGNSSTATGAVAVNVGTLGGTGRSGGAVTVAGAATLSPGASIESLDVASLSMASTSVFAYEILDATASGADLLASRGALSLTGVTLSLDALSLAALASGIWNPNDKLTLISYLGADVTSGFTGRADDTSYFFGENEWLFNYNDTVAGGNYGADAIAGGQNRFVTMTLIPEPNVAALLGGLGMLLLLRRRK